MAIRYMKKDIELISAMKAKVKEASEQKPRKLYWAIPLALTVFIVVSFYFVYSANLAYQKEIVALENYLDTTEAKDSVNTSAALNQKILDLTNQYNALVEFKETANDRPKLSNELIGNIFLCAPSYADVNSFNYDSEKDTIVIRSSGKVYTSAYQFVTNLKKTPYFESVTYTGYFESSELFEFTITAVFKAGVVK